MVSTNGEPARIVDTKRDVIECGMIMNKVEVRFASERTVEYVRNRLDRGSELFFGCKYSGGTGKQYAETGFQLGPWEKHAKHLGLLCAAAEVQTRPSEL